MNTLQSYRALCRIPIALFSAISAATGFLLASPHDLHDLLPASVAVFLLASGASALNQVQEQDIDAKMDRTRDRPIPAGLISRKTALLFSLSLILSGLLLLRHTGGMPATMLGMFTLLWYNGVYTGLKRIVPYAFIPGAVVGMLSPLIGYTAAGGSAIDQRILSLCFIFFIWQVPHFLLLLIRYGHEYKAAGLPSLARTLSASQLSRVASAWIAAAAVSSLLLPLFGAFPSAAWRYVVVPPAVWLVWNSGNISGTRPAVTTAAAMFRKVNIYLIIMLSLLILGSLIR